MEKRRILVAEDTELFLEIQSSFLKRASFDLHTARSGQETIDIARQVRPHLILMSFTLPDISGDEVCAVIKAIPELIDTRVVIVTDDFDIQSQMKCIDEGCDGIVTRPFEKEKLLETVQKLLGETFRRKPRFKVETPCALYLASEAVPATMVDISEIGCRVGMEEIIIEGSTIGIGFSLPDTEHPVNWKGIVRWTAGSGSALSAGIEFIDPPADEVQVLSDILAAMDVSERL